MGWTHPRAEGSVAGEADADYDGGLGAEARVQELTVELSRERAKSAELAAVSVLSRRLPHDTWDFLRVLRVLRPLCIPCPLARPARPARRTSMLGY